MSRKTAVIALDPGVPCTMSLLTPSGKWAMYAEKENLAINFKGKQWQNDAILMTNVMNNWLQKCVDNNFDIEAVLELASPRPGEGLVSSCKFTGSMYLFKGICAALGVRLTEVAPSVWKKDMKVTGSTYDDRKEKARQRALQEFHGRAHWLTRKLDHNRAESALIGLWKIRYGS